MTDQVPDVLEFETLKNIDESNKVENILKLEDPPVTEKNSDIDVESKIPEDKPEYNEDIIEPGELLNLHEPPKEEKEIIYNSDNKYPDDVISQFAQDLIDPIVKEALKLQNAEMEDSIIEVKVDSCGDKKSDKSLSDDGFEYLKADDINSSSGAEQNNEEMNQLMDNDKLNKTIDDLFMHEDLKLEDPIEIPNNLEERNDIILECSNPTKSESNLTDEEISEGEEFDLQNIIKEYENNITPNDKVSKSPVKQSIINELKSEPVPEKEEIISSSIYENFEPEIKMETENDICRKCKDVVCWKDPVMSSIILSVIMVIELGLMLDYSIISLMAYSGLLLLFSSFFYKLAVKFKLVRKCDKSNCSINVTSDDVQLCVDSVLKWIEYLFNEIKSLTYVESFTKNLKAFTFFWILTYVGQWFNLLSIIFMGTVTLFSLPLIYTTNKKTIDQIMNNVRGQIKDSINNVKSKFRQLLGRRV